ncbi:MAG: FecR domain-containing protein [Bdellovibrionota bacterium]
MLAVRMLLKTLVVSAFFLPLVASGSVGLIEKVGTGSSVKVSRGGASVHLKAGESLEPGDELSTDASTAVDIRLQDETLIRLGVNSSYKVQEDSKLHVLVHRLLSGVVRVLVKPTDRDHKDPTIKFRMNTQEGTIGVRGTEFVVQRTPGNTRIKGLDGEVLFGPADADFANLASFVFVTRGFQSSIAAGAKASAQPEKFDLKKYLDEVNAKNGLFGPLTGSDSSGHANRYVRAATPAPTPSATPVVAGSSQPPPKAEEEAKPKGAPGAPVNYQKMLFTGILSSDLAAVKKAIAHGANVSERSPDTGHTPLQMAITEKSGSDKEIFVALVAAGADVEALDENGHTALMFAALNHLDMEYVRTLVYPGGANIERKDAATGQTAEQMAKSTGYTEMATYLESDEAASEDLKALDEKDAAAAEKKHTGPRKKAK